ncbi:hypothetical protein H2203_008685 [Taxawa tesnikishii (nom. ined.)]|nr:hypothetical protein H2203_008685 [Dothideales sp. JES 119]
MGYFEVQEEWRGYVDLDKIDQWQDVYDNNEDYDDPQDEDYRHEIDESDEPYEYESDDDLVESGPRDDDCTDGEETISETEALGHRISVEEMKGSRTMQCLSSKDERWIPCSDDEDFELQGSVFLSGLCDQVPAGDIGCPDVVPGRHGCTQPNAVNNSSWMEGLPRGPAAMPFHPTCFEIYKRVSLLRLGHIDVAGLYALWKLNGAWQNFPRDKAVVRGREQDWNHEPGDEFLVVNPVFVSGLPALFASTLRDVPSFSPRNGAFRVSESHMENMNSPSKAASDDPFVSLPPELRDMVLGYLGSAEVCNLRLVSRVFRQLPISTFQRLLEQERPWLWEVWSSLPYSKWATTTARVYQRRNKAAQTHEQELELYRSVIAAEMPELLHDWRRAEPSYADIVPSPVHEAPSGKLPERNTDWFALFEGITKQWSQLRGLQNRRRIWNAAEEILVRIQRAREEGRIESRPC